MIGIAVIVFSGFDTHAILRNFSYICIYIIVPAYGAYDVWKQSLASVIISLLFFASQSVRIIGGDNWFPYAPPFSLSLSIGDFSDGQDYLFDYFSTSMVIMLALLLWVLLRSNKQVSSDT
jgi:hypothetical protein